MPFPRQNLSGMYRVLGEAISHVAHGSGAVTEGLFGMYVEPGQSVIGGDLIVDQPVVRYPVSAWPTVARGDVLHITLDRGVVSRVVREQPMKIADGCEAIVKLGGAA